MQNQEIAEIFSEMAFWMELDGENPFKVRAFQNGARAIEDASADIAELAREKRLGEIKGIGKGLTAAIEEYLASGTVAESEKLRAKFPAGIAELRAVPGLGPKKIKALYEALGIASIAELEYACIENRLLEQKGFGEKSQAKIRASLAEMQSYQGRLLLPNALAIASSLLPALQKIPGVENALAVGELRRSCETIGSLDFLLELKSAAADSAKLAAALEKNSVLADSAKNNPASALSRHSDYLAFTGVHESGLRVNVYAWDPSLPIGFAALEVSLTGAAVFVDSLGKNPLTVKAKDELDFFQQVKSAWIPPEAREQKSSELTEPKALVQVSDIRGVFHAHTTASDGANSLEEMAEKCQELGFEYLGISEHSQSAGYAGGLKADAILRQREEVARLNSRFSKFRIFHGIESDIHKDGALDYPEKILRDFDFVIASLHGQLQMPREEITRRVCAALENPYTTWLGHPTGRLLLGRKGADLDIEQVLATAAKNHKGLELNSNPYRLDLDWRHAIAAQKMHIPIGIFPDAHSTKGLEDISWGVLMARKAGLRKDSVVNTKNLAEISAWLRK